MPKSWKKFEEQVANLYASLGYNTTEDIQIYGKQVDVLASRHIVGAGLVRIAVECKFSENNKVKSDDVSNYLNWVASAINAGEIKFTAIVSNVGFGRSARDRVKGTGLRLLTVSDLENSILAVQDVAVENVRRYKERRIFQSYVRIGGVAANGKVLWDFCKLQSMDEDLKKISCTTDSILARLNRILHHQYQPDKPSKFSALYKEANDFSEVVISITSSHEAANKKLQRTLVPRATELQR